MSKFLFRAIRPDSSEGTGVIESADLETARRELTAAGLSVTLLKPASEDALELPSPPPELPPLNAAVSAGPASATKGFRSKWKENQKFNAVKPAPSPSPPPPPPEIPLEPPLPVETEGPRAATADQAKFRSRWRDNLKYNQEAKVVLPPPPPILSVPPPPVALDLEAEPLEVALNAPPPVSPPAPTIAPKPFRAKWKENLERVPAPEPAALEPDVPTLEVPPVMPTAGPVEPAVPILELEVALEPPALPLEPISQPEIAPRKSFNSRWKDTLRHNKPALDLVVPQVEASLPIIEQEVTESSDPIPQEPPPAPGAFLEIGDGSPKIAVPNTELEARNAPALDISSAAAARFGGPPDTSPRRSSRGLSSSRSLSSGKVPSLDLPPPSADPNEQTPMGASFVGGAEELALGAPSVDGIDELFSSETPSAPVTSIEFTTAAPEQRVGRLEPSEEIAEVPKPAYKTQMMDISDIPLGPGPKSKSNLSDINKTQMMDISDIPLGPGPKSKSSASDINKTQMMDISDIPLGPGPKSKSSASDINKTQMMDITDIPLGPGPKAKPGLSDANKTQMMDISELLLQGPGPSRPKSKSGSVSLDGPKTASIWPWKVRGYLRSTRYAPSNS